MIELFLSSDGKHTVHVAAETINEMVKLLPQAKLIYESVIHTYGTKAQMWEGVAKSGAKPGSQAERKDHGGENGERRSEAPLCPRHKKPMAYREGRYGAFWSCTTRTADGSWCPCTIDASGRLSTGKVAA